MFILLRKAFSQKRVFIFFCFIGGLIPILSFTHIIPVDFSGFFFQAVSFLDYHEYSYQFIKNYCDNPVNTGLNARAPLVPFFMAVSMSLLGKTLFGALLPFIIARILLLPVVFLASRQILDDRLAFLSTILLLLIPKLQTYSMSSPEADIFVALFYAFALFFYLKYKKIPSLKLGVATGVSLGLASLSKSTGLGLSAGFILAIFLENIMKNRSLKKIFDTHTLALLFSFIVFIGPYLFWTWTTHHMFYITTQNDRSLNYIFSNLPFLLETIPLYFLGIDFTIGGRFTIISMILFFFFIVGIFKSLISRQFSFTLPTLSTLFLMSIIHTCVIGGNIPANYELVTILGFTMIPASILLFLGLDACIRVITRWTPYRLIYHFFTLLLTGIILLKYTNNYFSSPYSLDFTGNEYYLSVQTIVTNRESLTQVNFTKENGLLMFQGPKIHREIRQQFYAYRTDPFAPLFQVLLKSFIVITVGLLFLTIPPLLQWDFSLFSEQKKTDLKLRQ